MSIILASLLLTSIPVAEGVLTQPKPKLFKDARWGLEVGLAMYRPNIDAEFNGQTPFQDIFGEDRHLMYQLRGHYMIPTVVGEAGLTLGLSYFNESASALTEDGDASGGKTSLRLIPVTALARWRYGDLDRWTGIPLSFQLSAGFNYAFWRIGRGDGNTAVVNGVEGSGGSLSVQLEAGVSLRLGRLDPKSEKILQQNFGIRDVELGVSWMHITAPIGGWDALYVGDSTWRAHLTVSF